MAQRRKLKRQQRSAALRPANHRRLRFEPLEDRRLLAISVDTLLDVVDANDGVTSLREAIVNANTTPGADAIDFAPALTAASPATILLTQGELAITDSLTINGPGAEWLTIDASGNDPTPDSTLDDGDNTNDGDGSRVFNVDDGDVAKINSVSISGLRLTGGDTTGPGGAVRFAARNESLTFENVVIEGNSSRYGGGIALISVNAPGVLGSDSQLTVTNSIIRNNVASAGSGGIATDHADVTLFDCVIENNRVLIAGDGQEGGGIQFRGSSLHAFTLLRSIVQGNSAPMSAGGGIQIRTTGSPERPLVLISESRITGNSAWSGGGVFMSGADAEIVDSTISQNTSASIEGASGSAHRSGFGGGIEVFSSMIHIVGSTLADNSVTGEVRAAGGGIWAVGTELTLHDSILFNNRAIVTGDSTSEDALGGGLYIGGTLSIVNSTLSGNLAQRSENSSAQIFGSGIYSREGPVVIRHSTVTGNAEPNAGGAFFLSDFDAFELDHAIVTDLLPLRLSRDGGSIPPINARFSLIAHNQGTGLDETPSGSPDANGNLIGGPVNGVIDPLLAPLANNGGPTRTHALLPGSPAIDAGDAGAVAGESDVPLYDQRGAPWSRVVDGDVQRSIAIDIGAFERQPNPLAGDYNFSGGVDAADYVIWRKTLGSMTELRADGDGDGAVDAGDYDVWRAGFGTVLPQTFVVDTLVDENDGDYAAGDLSLREAVARADQYRSHDTIEFAPALTAIGPARIVLTQGELAIADAVTINGPGAEWLTIDASGNDPTPDVHNGDGSRIFVDAVGSGLSISGLTLTGGDTSGRGGAVFATGNFSLHDSVVTGNAALGTASTGSGEGIFVAVAAGQAAILENNVFSSNYAQNAGGGLFVSAIGGTVTLLGNRIERNQTAFRGGGVAIDTRAGGRTTLVANLISTNQALTDGGGLWSTVDVTPTSLLEIRDSTIADNATSNDGGGIAATVRHGAKLKIVNSTVSGNTAKGEGGGILASSTSHVDIRYSTIVENNAHTGGGLQIDLGDVTLAGSIVAENVAPDGNPDALFGGAAQLTAVRNLIGDNSGTGLAPAPVGMPDNRGNLIGTSEERIEPGLGPLGDNGGPAFLDGSRLPTHAPLAGSVVIDAGALAIAGAGDVPEFDQRGMPFVRIANGDGVGDARIDIGAFERQLAEPNDSFAVGAAVLRVVTRIPLDGISDTDGEGLPQRIAAPLETVTMMDGALLAWLGTIGDRDVAGKSSDASASVADEFAGAPDQNSMDAIDFVLAQLVDRRFFESVPLGVA